MQLAGDGAEGRERQTEVLSSHITYAVQTEEVSVLFKTLIANCFNIQNYPQLPQLLFNSIGIQQVPSLTVVLFRYFQKQPYLSMPMSFRFVHLNCTPWGISFFFLMLKHERTLSNAKGQIMSGASSCLDRIEQLCALVKNQILSKQKLEEAFTPVGSQMNLQKPHTYLACSIKIYS